MWEGTPFAINVPAPTLLTRLFPLAILPNYSSQYSTTSPFRAIDVQFDLPRNSLILNPQDISMCLFREKVIQRAEDLRRGGEVNKPVSGV